MIHQRLKGYQAPFEDGLPPFGKLGRNVVIEEGARIFFPESIEIGDDVYIGHDAWLNAHRPAGSIHIGPGSWIRPRAFVDGWAGVVIGEDAGIGGYVQFPTSEHMADDLTRPVIRTPLWEGQIEVRWGSDGLPGAGG